jgi:triacylglycerol lipase
MQRVSARNLCRPVTHPVARLMVTRRVLLALASTFALTGSRAAHAAPDPPILFVHGNGDSAVRFDTIIWRFESNGWNQKRLFTINLIRPAALLDYTKPDPNRSTFDDEMRELASRVAEVLSETGEDRLILIAHSRGGNAVRHYI